MSIIFHLSTVRYSLKTNSNQNSYPLLEFQFKLYTWFWSWSPKYIPLSGGTSPYAEYMGLPPPPREWDRKSVKQIVLRSDTSFLSCSLIDYDNLLQVLLKPGFHLVAGVFRVVTKYSKYPSDSSDRNDLGRWDRIATRTTHQKRIITCQKHPLSSGNQFSATAATQYTQTTQIIKKSVKACCGIKVEVRKVKYTAERFMEEVQKYECLYNKYSKDFKYRNGVRKNQMRGMQLLASFVTCLNQRQSE